MAHSSRLIPARSQKQSCQFLHMVQYLRQLKYQRTQPAVHLSLLPYSWRHPLNARVFLLNQSWLLSRLFLAWNGKGHDKEAPLGMYRLSDATEDGNTLQQLQG